MQPAVSIIIPVYNVERYITMTLESVKKQTYKNIEVIVVNDGSKDNTSAVAKQVLSDCNFPWIVIDQEKQGVSVARNVGLSKASGEYVLFLDGDDIISEFFVEKMYKKAKELDCDIVFCKYAIAMQETGKLRIIQTYDNLYNSKVHKRFEKCANGLEVLRERTKYNVCILIGSAIYKRNFLINEKLLFVSGHWIGEDIEFIFKALFKAKRVASVNDVLAFYIQRRDSTTHLEGQTWKKMLAAKEVFECLERFFKKEYIDEKTKKLFKNYLKIHLWDHLKGVYEFAEIKDKKVFCEIYTHVKHFKPVGNFKRKSYLFIVKILSNLLPGQISLKLLTYLRHIKRLIKKINRKS